MSDTANGDDHDSPNSSRTSSRLVLASGSPRRLELLRRVGLDPDVVPAGVDEQLAEDEPAEDYVERTALDKARAVAAERPDSFVLAADTVVVIDDRVLGKPLDRSDARTMLEHLAGNDHLVMTSVVVLSPLKADGTTRTAHRKTATATVRMGALTEREIEWYVDSDEPYDKAGAYALQGAGAALVDAIAGDPTTVIGLPLRTTLNLLRTAGFE